MKYQNKYQYRNRKHQKPKPFAEINVIPYIDVMLVLLVIFMITTPLLSRGVQVDLPQAHAQALSTKEKEPLIVSIDSHGHYYLNIVQHPNKPINQRMLLTRVAAELQLSQSRHENRLVLVRGDRHVDYGQVVNAMVLLQHAGAPSVGLITDDDDEKKTHS